MVFQWLFRAHQAKPQPLLRPKAGYHPKPLRARFDRGWPMVAGQFLAKHWQKTKKPLAARSHQKTIHRGLWPPDRCSGSGPQRRPLDQSLSPARQLGCLQLLSGLVLREGPNQQKVDVRRCQLRPLVRARPPGQPTTKWSVAALCLLWGPWAKRRQWSPQEAEDRTPVQRLVRGLVLFLAKFRSRASREPKQHRPRGVRYPKVVFRGLR